MSYLYTYESRDLFEVNNKNIILTSSFYIPVKTNEEEYLLLFRLKEYDGSRLSYGITINKVSKYKFKCCILRLLFETHRITSYNSITACIKDMLDRSKVITYNDRIIFSYKEKSQYSVERIVFDVPKIDHAYDKDIKLFYKNLIKRVMYIIPENAGINDELFINHYPIKRIITMTTERMNSRFSKTTASDGGGNMISELRIMINCIAEDLINKKSKKVPLPLSWRDILKFSKFLSSIDIIENYSYMPSEEKLKRGYKYGCIMIILSLLNGNDKTYKEMYDIVINHKKEILDEINRILKVHSKTKELYNKMKLSRLILLKNKELCVEYTIIDLGIDLSNERE